LTSGGKYPRLGRNNGLKHFGQASSIIPHIKIAPEIIPPIKTALTTRLTRNDNTGMKLATEKISISNSHIGKRSAQNIPHLE